MAFCLLPQFSPYSGRFLPNLRRDQRLMGFFFYHPVIFRLVNAVIFIPCSNAGLSLYQLSSVSVTFNNAFHTTFIPSFVSCIRWAVDLSRFVIDRRRIDLTSVQIIRNCRIAFRLNKFLKNVSDNLLRIFIRYQPAYFALPDCLIPIRCRTAHIGAFFSSLCQRSFRFHGKILSIHIIYQILDFRYHLFRFIAACPGIKAIRHCYETHTKEWENLLNIISGFQIISAKTGQVFYNHTVNVSHADILHQPLKRTPVKIGSRLSQVDITVYNFDFIRMFSVPFLNEFPGDLYLHLY